jgi:hypothetical protein
MESNVNMFDYLPTHKLDEVDIEYPGNDVTKGPSMFPGLLGQRFDISQLLATKQLTTAGRMGDGIIQYVRSSPTSTASIIVGRPVFWSDKIKNVVTPDAVATSELAGFPVSVPTTKGNIIVICNFGEIAVLTKNPLTKDPYAAGDLMFLDISGGVATIDVLADATALNNTNFDLVIAKAVSVVAAGAVAKARLIRDLGLYNSKGAVA